MLVRTELGHGPGRQGRHRLQRHDRQDPAGLLLLVQRRGVGRHGRRGAQPDRARDDRALRQAAAHSVLAVPGHRHQAPADPARSRGLVPEPARRRQARAVHAEPAAHHGSLQRADQRADQPRDVRRDPRRRRAQQHAGQADDRPRGVLVRAQPAQQEPQAGQGRRRASHRARAAGALRGEERQDVRARRRSAGRRCTRAAGGDAERAARRGSRGHQRGERRIRARPPRPARAARRRAPAASRIRPTAPTHPSSSRSRARRRRCVRAIRCSSTCRPIATPTCTAISRGPADARRCGSSPTRSRRTRWCGRTRACPCRGEAAIKVGSGPETVACFASDNDPILTAGREALGRGFEVEATGLSDHPRRDRRQRAEILRRAARLASARGDHDACALDDCRWRRSPPPSASRRCPDSRPMRRPTPAWSRRPRSCRARRFRCSCRRNTRCPARPRPARTRCAAGRSGKLLFTENNLTEAVVSALPNKVAAFTDKGARVDPGAANALRRRGRQLALHHQAQLAPVRACIRASGPSARSTRAGGASLPAVRSAAMPADTPLPSFFDEASDRTIAGDVRALPKGYRIDEFEILEVIGSGGFGIVYKAFDHSLNQARAIKEYLPRGARRALLHPRGDGALQGGRGRLSRGPRAASSPKRACSRASTIRRSCACTAASRRTRPRTWSWTCASARRSKSSIARNAHVRRSGGAATSSRPARRRRRDPRASHPASRHQAVEHLHRRGRRVRC